MTTPPPLNRLILSFKHRKRKVKIVQKGVYKTMTQQSMYGQFQHKKNLLTGKNSNTSMGRIGTVKGERTTEEQTLYETERELITII